MSEQQRTFPYFGVLPGDIGELDPIAVAGCQHWAQALRLCLSKSKVKRVDRQWARLLGMAPSTFNTLKNADHHEAAGSDRVRHLNPDLIAVIQSLTQNRAIGQYLEMRERGELFCQRKQVSPEEELANLKAHIANLERELADQRGDEEAAA